MPFISEEYPVGINDSELIEIVKSCSTAATRAARPDSNISAGVSYWKEMAELGQNEINTRVQKNLLTEISNLKEETIV
jgi:hypothetical protein